MVQAQIHQFAHLESIKQLLADMEGRFLAINLRLDAVDQRLDQMERMMVTHDDMDEVHDEQVKDLKALLKIISKKVEERHIHCHGRLASLDERLVVHEGHRLQAVEYRDM